MPQLHQAEVQKLDHLVFGQQGVSPAGWLQAVRVARPARGSKTGVRKHERVSDPIATLRIVWLQGPATTEIDLPHVPRHRERRGGTRRP